MGVVYLARADTGDMAVVKVVQFDLADNPEFRRRFRREVLAASAVDSDYISAHFVSATGRRSGLSDRSVRCIFRLSRSRGTATW